MGQFTLLVPSDRMVLEATFESLVHPSALSHELGVVLHSASTNAFDVSPVIGIRGDGVEDDGCLSGGEGVVKLVELLRYGTERRVQPAATPQAGRRVEVREPCPVALLTRPHQRGPMSSIQN